MLRSEIHTLAESYAPVLPLVIPLFKKTVPTPPPSIFDLFSNNDEA